MIGISNQSDTVTSPAQDRFGLNDDRCVAPGRAHKHREQPIDWPKTLAPRATCCSATPSRTDALQARRSARAASVALLRSNLSIAGAYAQPTQFASVWVGRGFGDASDRTWHRREAIFSDQCIFRESDAQKKTLWWIVTLTSAPPWVKIKR